MASVQPTLDWYKETSRREGGTPRCPLASDDPRHFRNFCPEALFELFGLFANNLSEHADEIDRGVAESQLKAEHAPASDWRWTWALATAMHYTDCPLYSPLLQDGPNHSSLPDTMCTQRNDRDPFRIVIGLIDNSDTLLSATLAAGLQFEAGLSDTDAVSHRTRVRALVPRILAAYDALEDDSHLTVALATVEALRGSGFDMAAAAIALDRAGWELHDAGFVVRSPETREMFFPKGSPWDAFVVLRDLFAEAKGSIFIVDPYCTTSVFHMLEERPLNEFNVQILCSKHANAVAEGSRAFVGQHPHVTVEVRTNRDFHDRFIVLDRTVCVHLGASIKDAGKKACMVSRIEDPGNREAMLRQIDESWANGTRVP